MQFVKSINIKSITEIIIAIISIPVIVKILYFINILGIYFGSFLREISSCIGQG